MIEALSVALQILFLGIGALEILLIVSEVITGLEDGWRRASR